jgi:predicted aspartyl protease
MKRFLFLLALTGPVLAFEPAVAPASPAIPFQRAGGHLLKIPVTLNGNTHATFILDTGIGINVLSKDLADKLGCAPTRTYQGSRMSGQTLTVPIAKLPTLTVGNEQSQNVEFGLWDMHSLLGKDADLADVQGMLSLKFFENRPFTVDYQAGTVVLESPDSLKAREKTGQSVPVKLEQDQSTTMTVWVELRLPDEARSDGLQQQHHGRHGGGGGFRSQRRKEHWAEVDTASNVTVLNEKYMNALGVQPGTDKVRREDGKDETGGNYVRYFTKLDSPLVLVADRKVREEKPDVMFQRIVYDALLGNEFLRNYTVTYDLPHRRMIFNSWS